MEFELAYYDAAVYYVNHCTTESSSISTLRNNEMSFGIQAQSSIFGE